MNILLIDNRVSRYEDIIAAIDPALAVGIVFDYDTDTFETIKVRIGDALSIGGTDGSVSVGLIQHNYNAPTFSMVAGVVVAIATEAETDSSQQQQQQQQPSCIVAQVETLDPALESWAQFKEFIVWCKTECGAAHFDMMACALYSNPDWKYIIDTLPKQTGVDVRASTDDTGSAALGGNWFLESHAGINLKAVYLTELIETYRGVLGPFSDNSFVITGAGAVYATGDNGLGQLGLGDTVNKNVPTLITSGIGSLNVVAVSTGYRHSLFLTSTGAVYATGWNVYGQLGLGDTVSRNVPTLITSGIGSLNVVAVSAGQYHSLFLTSTGAVYATGYNGYGGLGLGDTGNKNVPTLITSGIGGLKVVAVSGGQYHSLFLTSTGAVYATGWNGSGQLGLGDTAQRNVPTLITSGIGSLNVVAVSAGRSHSLILTSTGAVYATGYNNSGHLGLGDTSIRNVPTLITSGIGGLNVVAVSAGSEHSLFLTSTGAVYATGFNGWGGLGLGDLTQRNVPTLITSGIGSLNVVAVSGGLYHSLFITSTGAVYATGENGYGQLGLGDISQRNVPTLMSGTYSRIMDVNNAPAKFVGTGNGSYSIAYSYDGVRWIPVLNSKSIFSGKGTGITYSTILSRWVAVGEGTTNSIAYSLDGITWFGGGTSIFSINGNGVGPLT